MRLAVVALLAALVRRPVAGLGRGGAARGPPLVRRGAYADDVAEWLRAEAVPFTRDTPTSLRLGPQLRLRLLATPRAPGTAEREDSRASALLTDALARGPTGATLVHLHEDVWRDKPEICKARLLAKVRQPPERCFARQTTARRIDAAVAGAFLREHHLWGAIRAKHKYGLFSRATSARGARLVAVATFSPRRHVRRGGVVFRSHELLRYCAERDGAVVGGITKLLAAFSKDHRPDDIVTVVDRDFGSAAGWEKIGFVSVHVMPPLPMCVGADGLRRYLVGVAPPLFAAPPDAPPDAAAGVARRPGGRLEVPPHVMAELHAMAELRAAGGRPWEVLAQQRPWEVLARLGYHAVFDAGVERLLLVVNGTKNAPSPADAALAADAAPSPGGLASGDGAAAVPERGPTAADETRRLWRESVPRYADRYYSDNAGVAAMCAAARRFSDHDRACLRRASDHRAEVVFEAPSSLDPAAAVRAVRRGDYVTVGLRSAEKSIYHGLLKDGEPAVVVSDYLRGMIALALAELVDVEAPRNFLHLGLGAGILPAFLGHTVPGSHHVSVEADAAVVAALGHAEKGAAARDWTHHVVSGDAVDFAESVRGEVFDAIFTDVFDAANACPPKLYSDAVLLTLRGALHPAHGVLLHNMHSGARRQAEPLREAQRAFAATFPAAYTVASKCAKPWAGNLVLVGCVGGRANDAPDARRHRAARAQARWNIETFDLADHVSDATEFAVATDPPIGL